MSEPNRRENLVAEAERYFRAKYDQLADPPGGCFVLFAVELSSAVNALEALGAKGQIEIDGHVIEIGGRSAPR